MGNFYNYNEWQLLMGEGIAQEHPDVAKQPAFAARADAILAARAERRQKAERAKANAARVRAIFNQNTIRREEYDLGEAKDEEYSMARGELSSATRSIKRLNKKLKGEGELEAWVQSKITKASDYLRAASDYMDSGESDVNEETMTKADIKREKQLKKKYDDSKMKANFIKQYGEEKGKQYYFAYIRKKAMAEDLEIEEEYKELPRKKMLTRAGKHNFYAGWVQGEWETNRINKGKKRDRTKEMVNDATEKANKIYDTVLSHDPEAAKAKSKYNPIRENYDYYSELLDEAKRTKAERLQANIEKDKRRTRGGPRYDKQGKRLIRGKRRIYDWDRVLGGAPEARIRVVNKNTGEVEQRLTDTEHYKHHEAGMLEPHQKYEYSEFNDAEKVARGRTNPKIIRRLKKEIRRGKPVSVVTARSGSVASGINKALAKHGIKPGRVKLHLTGDMPRHIPTPERKSIVFKHILKKHPAGGTFIDDYVPNVEAAKKHPKLKALLAQPNERGEVMARPHRQQRAEDFELWIENLLDEGYDLSEFTVDELYETFEFYMDQLNEDLATKVRGAANAVTKGIFNQNVPQNSGTLNRTLNAASQVAGGAYRGLAGRETSSTNPIAQYANQNARNVSGLARTLSPITSNVQNKLWQPASAAARGALLNEPTKSSDLRDKIANAAGRGARALVSGLVKNKNTNESIQFELWVNSLINEGYDLSEFTVDELYETFEYVLDEAKTAIGAPAPGERPPYRKTVNPKLPKFGYTDKFTKPSKKIKEEDELTPYEFWKSFISEDEDVVDEYDDYQDELEEDIEITPYDVWKAYFSEKYIDEAAQVEDDVDGDGQPDTTSGGQKGNILAQQRAMQRSRKKREQDLKTFRTAQELADRLKMQLGVPD